MKRVEQLDKDATKAFQENITPGRIGSLKFYFTGTNAVGQVGDFKDLGNVKIKRNQETRIERPIHVFADKQNILGGSNKFSSTDGGAFIAVVKVPLYVDSFEQAWQVVKDNEMNLAYTPSGNEGTVFTDLSVKVYAELSFLDEEYDYFLLGDDQTPSSSVSNRNYPLNIENLTTLFLGDPDLVLSSAGIRSDGEEAYTESPKDVLEGDTLENNQLEQTSIDLLAIKMYTKKQPGSVLNENNVLKYSTSGAGTIEISKEYIRLKNRRINRRRAG